MEALNYKCPNCSAGLSFDSKTQKMVCKYCGSSYTVEELEKLLDQEQTGTGSAQESAQSEQTQPQADTSQTNTSDNHWDEFNPQEWSSEEKEQTIEWNCPSCGAQMVTDKTVGAAICPYCDNPMVVPQQFQGSFKPDYVIPFKKDKKDAIDALNKHYQGKPLLPRVFKDQNHIEEVKAVYVPFWLFDLEGSGRMQFDATTVRFWSDMDFNYTETSHYNIVRAGEMDFKGIPVDGSKKIDDTMMEAIEPYNYEELKPFEMSYLSGYMANKYDELPDDLTDRVYERMKKSVRDSLAETVIGYQTVVTRSEDIRATRKGKVKYGLLPVWFLNTKWNGQVYSFAMNGQTGKLIGDLPVGKDLAVAYWFKYHLLLTAVIMIILVILLYTGVI